MLRINKAGWVYRFTYGDQISADGLEATNLCGFVLDFLGKAIENVFACVIVAFLTGCFLAVLFALACLVYSLIYAVTQISGPALTVVSGAIHWGELIFSVTILALVATCLWVIGSLVFRVLRPIGSATKEVAGLFLASAKAAKQKVCPLIEYVESSK